MSTGPLASTCGPQQNALFYLQEEVAADVPSLPTLGVVQCLSHWAETIVGKTEVMHGNPSRSSGLIVTAWHVGTMSKYT